MNMQCLKYAHTLPLWYRQILILDDDGGNEYEDTKITMVIVVVFAVVVIHLSHVLIL